MAVQYNTNYLNFVIHVQYVQNKNSFKSQTLNTDHYKAQYKNSLIAKIFRLQT